MSPARATIKITTLAFAAALITSSGPAFAQSSAAAPTREEIQRGLLDETLSGLSQTVSVEGGIERSACPLANAEFSDVRFTLNNVDFSGLSVVDPAILRSSYYWPRGSGFCGLRYP